MPVFDSVDDYVALPRVTGLRLSPDGRRLVASVSAPAADGKAFVTSLWDIDPAGAEPPGRLTVSAQSATASAMLPNGDVLFLSKRPDADPRPDPDLTAERPSLWLLPARGGEARRVAGRAGGFSAIGVAEESGTIVLAAETLPAALDEGDDARLRKERDDRDVRAILHEQSPVRYWDRDLGPGETRLLVGVTLDGGDDAHTLTPQPGRALDEAEFAVVADGSAVVTTWSVPDEPGLRRNSLVEIDITSGARRVLADEAYVSFDHPAVSRDGRWVACVRSVDGNYDDPSRRSLWLIDRSDGVGRELAVDEAQWPTSVTFGPEGVLYFTADEQGRHPVFRLDPTDAGITRVANDGHYSDVAVSPDGRTLFALHDRIDIAPRPVRLDAEGVDQSGTPLPAPGAVPVPGRVEEVTTDGLDGHPVRGWLVLPDGASADSPAPLLLWVHGGPLSSWNSWSWRWNPWLLAARGYAVLLPDPALSTGYGEKMLRRGWGQWGGAPYDDLMAITDTVVARADIDEGRTAAMGGSYGGYMANWIAGHTDRFRCIVTHASLWSLEAFTGTTDLPAYWVREWGAADVAPERYQKWSPNRFADAIRTPMLVIHGDKDYRVPIGEGLSLWWDLQRRGVESKFLYFPDENHWILKPGGTKVWYETVFAWLAVHVLGEEWQRPGLV